MRGKLMLDDDTHLTPTQSKLLLALLEHDEPVPSDELYSKVWGTQWMGGIATLYTTMCHLRKKVEPYFKIETIKNGGPRALYQVEVNSAYVPQMQ